MRTLIAIPCMNTVHTRFFTSVIRLLKPEGTDIAVSISSLVYNARNMLAKKALDEGFDRVLWLDSDMKFEPQLLEQLSAEIDLGLEYVSALYFTRVKPYKPCIYQVLDMVKNKEGADIPTATPFRDYPDGLFEIAGSGFGAVMMTTDLIRRCGAQPFFPVMGFGEDFSFCLRAREAGATLWCDSRIQVTHLGEIEINEETYLAQRKEGDA